MPCVAEDDGVFRGRASLAEQYARSFVRRVPRRRVNVLVQNKTINRTRTAFRLTTKKLRGAPQGSSAKVRSLPDINLPTSRRAGRLR